MSYISRKTLNVNGLNSQLREIEWLSGFFFKKDQIYAA